MQPLPAGKIPSPEAMRFTEIDTLRGVAVAMMVLYHALFDLAWTGVAPIPVTTGFWKIFQLATATLFLGIAGVSLSLSGSRARGRLEGTAFLFKFTRRGLSLVGAGMLITAITLILVPGEPVLFGVLHCIGVSILLAPAYLRLGRFLPVAGAAVILVGITMLPVQGPLWLLPLGVYPPGFASLDWVPLFPWLGVVMLGAAVGGRLYPGGTRGFRIPPFGGTVPAVTSWMGRHSLFLYFLHQPVLLGIFSLLIPGFLHAFASSLS